MTPHSFHNGFPSLDNPHSLSSAGYNSVNGLQGSSSSHSPTTGANIVVIGVSGYVGGDTVAHLIRHHPEYHIAVLVRNRFQFDQIRAIFPTVTIIQGHLNSFQLLRTWAKWADVVLQIADSDHVTGSQALMRGLVESQQADGKTRTYIHISSIDKVIDPRVPYGYLGGRVYGDIDDAEFLYNLPPHRPHADIDRTILTTGEESGLRTAIVSLPMIHGIGTGPIRQKGRFATYLNAVIHGDRAFVVGAGQNMWSQVDISDVSMALLTLTAEGLKPHDSCRATWGRSGYYFVEGSEASWDRKAYAISRFLHAEGWLNDTTIYKLLPQEAEVLHPQGGLMFAADAKVRAQRLRALGWTPKGGNWLDSLDYTIWGELYGLTRGFYPDFARLIKS
ncbi:MAG: hypothetical protein M1812_002489 [Candelaria pacifica]|nr:MAG: hypothetical protein M1812_002489 [Candelaria pacifica]